MSDDRQGNALHLKSFQLEAQVTITPEKNSLLPMKPAVKEPLPWTRKPLRTRTQATVTRRPSRVKIVPAGRPVTLSPSQTVAAVEQVSTNKQKTPKVPKIPFTGSADLTQGSKYGNCNSVARKKRLLLWFLSKDIFICTYERLQRVQGVKQMFLSFFHSLVPAHA